MCIVAIAWQLFDELPLVLLSNRDEFLQRPTERVRSSAPRRASPPAFGALVCPCTNAIAEQT